MGSMLNESGRSYFDGINRFTNWCEASNLSLSTEKNK